MAFQNHARTNHGRNTGSVAYCLGTCFFVCRHVGAIVPNIIRAFLTVFHTFNPASDAGETRVVFTQILRGRQYGFEELQRNDLHAFKIDRFNTRHADVLNHPQVCEVFLTKCHPETRPAQGGEVFDQTFQFLVVNEVRTFWANFRVVNVLPDFMRLCFNPLAVLPVFTPLCYLADVDFRVKIGGKRFAVIACICVYDVQFVNFIEVMFVGISGKYTGYTRVKTTSQQRHDAFFFKSILVCPLPGIFKLRYVLGFIIGGIHVVGSRF